MNQNDYKTTTITKKTMRFNHSTRVEKVGVVTMAISLISVELQFPFIFGERVESQHFEHILS